MLQYIHYRTRLKLYHPSQQECKTRCCDDSDTGTEGYSSDGEEVKNNRISLDRSDSLVIHDVPETIPIDKKTGKITPFHTIIKPILRFIKHYFIQLGILDGHVGLTISSYQAKAVKMRYNYLRKYRNERRNK